VGVTHATINDSPSNSICPPMI